MTRVGLIARGDDRGLGHMTWEFARHLNPAKVLGVAVTGSPWPNRWDRYDADRLTVVGWRPSQAFASQGGSIADGDAEVRAWLDGLDVVYSAETFYDWRIVEWARQAGVATVLHAMPELLPELPPAHHPTLVWAPTSWRADRFRCDRIVPVPVNVDVDRGPYTPDERGRLRILHVHGTGAASDRNGTDALLAALRYVTADVLVTIRTQVNMAGLLPRLPSNVELVVRGGGERYWTIYDDAELLVMPRRYGGLCLPVQEAAAAGLGVLLTDLVPNHDYPGVHLIPVHQRSTTFATPAGLIDVAEPDVEALAALIDLYATDPALVVRSRLGSIEWAAQHSWTALGPLYVRLLEQAAGR